MSDKSASDRINVPTVVVAVALSALIAALVITLAAVLVAKTGAFDGDGEAAAQPQVVNLGGAPQAQVPGGAVPVAPAAPSGGATPADGAQPAPEAAPVAPAAPAPGPGGAQPAPPSATAPAATAPEATAQNRRGPMNVREAKVADLYVRAERPSLSDLEWQFAAFWNPQLPINPKLEVSYNGPAARAELVRVMEYGRTYDFFSMQGNALPPITINGDRMSVEMRGSMAGFPVQQFRYHYLRQNGLWKFDWKKTCVSMGGCSGNPDFGY